MTNPIITVALTKTTHMLCDFLKFFLDTAFLTSFKRHGWNFATRKPSAVQYQKLIVMPVCCHSPDRYCSTLWNSWITDIAMCKKNLPDFVHVTGFTWICLCC